MSDSVTVFPRRIRPVPQPLGFYLRPGHSDHPELTKVLLSGPHKLFGAVIDATLVELQKDLRQQLLSSRLDVILDPKTQPAAFAEGFRPSMGKLPWGAERAHQLDDFRDLVGRQRIIKLAEFVVAKGFTQVIAPTHFLMSSNDPWFGVDLELVRQLRIELDRRGGRNIPIIYSLAIAGDVFKDAEQRAALIAGIAGLPIGSLWLKVDKFGASVSAIALTRFMNAITEFHALGVPIIADRVGGVPAMALLAFGAVGGIAHGVTSGENFSSYAWRKPQTSSRGGGGWRIYCPPLGILLSRKEAEFLFASSPRAKGQFANRNQVACPRGLDDMLAHPVRAFVIERAEEVARLSAVPETLRPQHFLEKSLRPITDCALAATKIAWKDEDELGKKLGVRLMKHRKHVEDLRIALGARAEALPPRSFAQQPATRISRDHQAS
jgi:hypothetical protein